MFKIPNTIDTIVTTVVNRSNGISAIFSILISHENEDGINKYSVYCSGKTDDLTKFFSNK